jgi:PIN domain nuclease of toxin-antitoxin system
MIASLPLTEEAIGQMARLPAHHRDPFDRILVCQALEHSLTLVTVDPAARVYSVPMLSAP